MHGKNHALQSLPGFDGTSLNTVRIKNGMRDPINDPTCPMVLMRAVIFECRLLAKSVFTRTYMLVTMYLRHYTQLFQPEYQTNKIAILCQYVRAHELFEYPTDPRSE